jgi:hypothetical protein
MTDKEITAVETENREEEKSLTDQLNKTLLDSFLKRINSGDADVPQFERSDEIDEQWPEEDELVNMQNGSL